MQVLLLVGLVALVLRGVVCMELSSHPTVVHPAAVTDMATYRALAMDIRQGKWPDHFDYQPFYYTIFLPLLYCLSPGSTTLILVAQTLVGTLAVLFTGWATALLFGRKAGLAAALLLALSRFHIFYTPFLLYEVLASLWLSIMLWLSILAWRGNRLWQWLLLAGVCAVATLTRGNALLLFPGVLGFMIWRNRRRPVRATILLLLSLCLFYLPQLPYALRNWKYAGRWTGPSTAGDKVLALGNTPEAPPGGLEYPLLYHAWCRQSDDGQVSVPRNMVRWFLSEPLAVLELKARAFLLYWDRREIPNNVSIQREGKASRLLSFPLLVPYFLIAALALMGMALNWRRRSPKRLLLYYMAWMFCFSTVLFYILARFRIAGLPLQCAFAGAGVQALLALPRRWRKMDAQVVRQQRLMIILLVIGSFFFTCAAYSLYQDYGEAAAMRLLRPQGVCVTCSQDDSSTITRSYDHGPLSFGGVSPLRIPAAGLDITKRLCVPADAASAADKTACFRLLVFAPPNAVWKGTLEHGGVRYPITNANLEQDRFLNWLRVPLETLAVQEDGMAVFRLRLQPDAKAEMAVGADFLRDFHRTDFASPDYPAGSIPPAEACGELDIIIPKE